MLVHWGANPLQLNKVHCCNFASYEAYNFLIFSWTGPPHKKLMPGDI
jgi:hypothetical protein